MDNRELKSVNPEGTQPWIFIGKTDVEAEALILGPPDSKSWLIGKDPDAGKDWGQEEKRTIENEMVRWHHRLNGYEFEQTPGDSEGQGGLVCCGPCGHKELDTTEWLNNNPQHPPHLVLQTSVQVMSKHTLKSGTCWKDAKGQLQALGWGGGVLLCSDWAPVLACVFVCVKKYTRVLAQFYPSIWAEPSAWLGKHMS